MNKTAATILPILLMLCATGLLADEQKKPEGEGKARAEASTGTAEAKEGESPLVKAARESKARREGEKSRISITNDDVKKSDGKLIQSTSKPLEPLPGSSDVEKTMRDVASAKEKKSNRTDLQASITKYQQEVDTLEKELRRIEETYYNEDDPDYREDVLAVRFEETKRQLEAAREQLGAARKALAGGN